MNPFAAFWETYTGTFEHPILFPALTALALALLTVSRFLHKRPTLRFSDAGLIESVRESRFLWTRHIPFGLRTAAVVLLIAAFARPRTEVYSDATPTEGVSIMLALDASSSMAEEDMARGVTRLEAARGAAREFIEGRPFDRIGLVSFARYEKTVCPLTLDHEILNDSLGEVDFAIRQYNSREMDGTNIAQALLRCLQRLKDVEAKSRIIVLITDGEQTVEGYHPVTAAKMAKSLDPPIRIYAIGIGVPSRRGAPFDEETLREISDESGGRYYWAKGKEDMSVIFREIDELEKSDYEGQLEVGYQEKFAWAALPAFALLLLEALLATTILRRIP